MKGQREYYVFLKPIVAADGYKKSEEERRTYLPSTTTYLIVPVQEGKHTLLD